MTSNEEGTKKEPRNTNDKKYIENLKDSKTATI